MGPLILGAAIIYMIMVLLFATIFLIIYVIANDEEDTK